MSEGVVSVGRMTVRCTVPRNHPQPDSVRRRLDDVLAGPLRAALTTMLAPLERLPGDEIVMVERLELDVALDTSRALDDVAGRWAAQLARQLVGVVAGDSRQSQLRFADEAHLLARFVSDEAAGQARDKWYYRRYRGLFALPAPAVLRSALVDDPARGVAALGALAPDELGRVLAALGEREAERVVQAIAALDGERDAFARAAEALVEAVDAVAAVERTDAARAAGALGLIACAAARLAPALWPSLARLATALVESWVQPADTGPRANGLAAPALAPLAALRPEQRAALAALRPGAAAAAPPIATASMSTRFGGLVMLLGRLADWPIDALFSDAADRALLRLALLARCAGPQRRRSVLGDALLQRLCGLDDGTSAADVEAWMVTHGERLARALPPLLAAWRQPFVRSTCRTLARAGGATAAISVGEPDGYWLAVEAMSPSRRADLRVAAPEVTRDLSLARARARSRWLRHVLADEAPADVEHALALAAQQLLHGFARTLVGFAASSPAFLYENFLAFGATVEELGERRICRMGRPPLAALLALTGAQRGRIVLPWLARGVVELYPGG